MLIGGLVTHQLISSSVLGVGSLIDGSQNAVWPLVLEDEFRYITLPVYFPVVIRNQISESC